MTAKSKEECPVNKGCEKYANELIEKLSGFGIVEFTVDRLQDGFDIRGGEPGNKWRCVITGNTHGHEHGSFECFGLDPGGYVEVHSLKEIVTKILNKTLPF